MAIIERDVTLRRYGSLGGALVYSSYKSLDIVKVKGRYTYRNTPVQRANRARFALAVKTWQGLSVITQYLWRYLAYGKGMSGYEYYIKRFILDRR